MKNGAVNGGQFPIIHFEFLCRLFCSVFLICNMISFKSGNILDENDVDFGFFFSSRLCIDSVNIVSRAVSHRTAFACIIIKEMKECSKIVVLS